jgi:predicted homoserine dehydrogenase-like protein
MVIVDNLLKAREEQGNPVRLGLIGAGFIGQGLANMIVNSTPGMRMAAIFNRTVERAVGVYRYAGRDDVVPATARGELEDAIRAGRPVVTEDAFLLSRSEQIDVLVDVTGPVDSGRGSFSKRSSTPRTSS